MSASASGCSLSKGAAALAFERDPATGLYRISSGGMLLTESGRSAVLAGADGSASQLWRVSACEGGYAIVSASGMALDDYAQSTDEGNRVWLHAPNGTAAQAWLLADPAVPRAVDDGDYRLASSLDGSMAVSASASGCSLSSGAGALTFGRDAATGLYRISSGGMLLTESGRSAVLAGADGSASQLWRVSACEGGYAIVSASGMALDDYAQSTDEGNRVWLHAPNGTAAQAWLLADPAVPRAVDDGDYRLASSLDGSMAVSASASGCSLSSGAGAPSSITQRASPTAASPATATPGTP